MFGSACYPYLRPFQQHKLQFHSQQCVFLGSYFNRKGYKCLTDDGKVLVSRHVSFDETWFPFQHGFSRSKVVAKDKSCHQQTSIPIVESPVHIASTRSKVPAVPLEAIPTPASPNPHFSTPIPSSDEFSSEGTSSASTVPSSTVQEAPVNRHPICTRSKNGIYKPNLFTTVLTEKEPSNIMEAFQSPA